MNKNQKMRIGTSVLPMLMTLCALFLSPVMLVWANDPGTELAKSVQPWKVVTRENVATVWSGNPVGFKFIQKENQLFIGFYSSEDKSMVIGHKASLDAVWTFKSLPTKIGWDSHNYIEMAFDRDNLLHVTGNMHAIPLIYFCASKPLDIESLEPVHRMISVDTKRENLVAARESRVTYPIFMFLSDGRMVFTYRDGGSGNGSQLWNVYNEQNKTWTRFLDVPMFDGLGECNAYFVGPKLGPDGWYHIAWVWRDTPDCATNHDLSYMRSKDLIHWENSRGEPLTLPVTTKTGEVVAPLQNGQGLLNSLVRLGFDPLKRVVITYTRYDEQKNNQLMQARLEKDEAGNPVWRYYQTTDWTHSWVFSGGGCIPGELSFSDLSTTESGKMIQFWNRKNEKSGEFELDINTMKPVGPAPKKSSVPSICYKKENDQENQRVKSGSVIDQNNPNRLYFFAWETLPVNRDRPHKVVPQPSQLRMFVLER